MKRVRGLSVLEVVVSVGIVAIAGLGLIAALTRAMIAQSSTSHQTVARVLAESQAQDALLAGPPNWSRRDVSEQVFHKRVGQNNEPADFFYDIIPKKVVKPDSLSPGPDMGDLWEVQVKIWWNADEGGPQGAIERGTQTLTVTRVAYVQK